VCGQVTATSTIGKPLPDAELKKVFESCDAVIELDEAKKKVQRRIRIARPTGCHSLVNV
jgi:hypothetical protein